MATINTRTKASFISGGGIFAAGTSYFNDITGSAGTTRPTGEVAAAGRVYAAGTVQAGSRVLAGSYVKSTTYVQSGTGYVTGKGDTKQFSCGTYYGKGGATAPIIATGLTTVYQVFMGPKSTNYAGGVATAGVVICKPCVSAVSTPGSFYPFAFQTLANGGIKVNTVSATFSWLAFGAKTIT